MNLDDKKDPPQKVIKFILNLVNNNNFEDAKIEIKKEVINFPNSSTLYNILGAVFAGESQLNEAIQNYNKSIEINPEYAEAYNNLGIALQGLNKTSEAIESYKKALELRPNSINTLLSLAKTLTKNPYEHEEALNIYKKVLQIDPNSSQALNGIGICYVSKKDFDKAISFFRKAIELKPGLISAHYNLGLSLLKIGEFEEGFQEYDWRKYRKKRYVNQEIFKSLEWKGETLNSKTILDFTYNPDYGQIEQDPSIINNTAYELKFEEKREFFLEEMSFFYTPINIFYSRRIGGDVNYLSPDNFITFKSTKTCIMPYCTRHSQTYTKYSTLPLTIHTESPTSIQKLLDIHKCW